MIIRLNKHAAVHIVGRMTTSDFSLAPATLPAPFSRRVNQSDVHRDHLRVDGNCILPLFFFLGSGR